MAKEHLIHHRVFTPRISTNEARAAGPNFHFSHVLNSFHTFLSIARFYPRQWSLRNSVRRNECGTAGSCDFDCA